MIRLVNRVAGETLDAVMDAVESHRHQPLSRAGGRGGRRRNASSVPAEPPSPPTGERRVGREGT